MKFNKVFKTGPKTKIRQPTPELSYISPHNPHQFKIFNLLLILKMNKKFLNPNNLENFQSFQKIEKSCIPKASFEKSIEK
jgi:hypothetical protein